MKINEVTLAELAIALSAERKRQKLSREDAAAACGVSTSFIRDAESSPENCSIGKLAKLINGLGLSLEVSGLEVPQLGLQKLDREQVPGLTPSVNTRPRGLIAAAMGGFQQVDFGVPDSQLVGRAKGGLLDVISEGSSQPTTGLGLASLVAQRGVKGKPKGETS